MNAPSTYLIYIFIKSMEYGYQWSLSSVSRPIWNFPAGRIWIPESVFITGLELNTTRLKTYRVFHMAVEPRQLFLEQWV